MQLAVEDPGANSSNCGEGYSCAYTNTISWSSPTDAAADGAESAGGVRAHVRRRQHGRAARRAPQARPQHPGLADRQPLAPAQRRQRRRSRAPRRLHRERSRDRAPAADRDEGLDRRADRYDRAGRRAADLRRAHQAAVRPAGAGLPGRHHPRRHAAVRPRPDRPHLSGKRSAHARASTASRITAKIRSASPSCRRSTSIT